MAPPVAQVRQRIDWRWVALAGIVAAVLLAALSWSLYDPPVTARPALWRISKGDRHAWLFGTIHAVPAGARWLSPAIRKAADESSELVLEATGLETEHGDGRIFEMLGRSPNLPPLAARLSAPDRARFAALIKAEPALMQNGIDGYESWAAALIIGSVGNAGLSRTEAGEARLEHDFRETRRPVIGLETVAETLGAFDTLAEPDQRAMLAQTIAEASDAPAQFKRLYASWETGDLQALHTQFIAPLDHMPAVRNALIDQRNVLWTRQIDGLLRKDTKVRFIAVGTGHLLGPGSVPARLAALGWDVERMQ